ncbi:MAG TPA: N-acetyl-gamma-glutamyl-phosphate reductase [Anaerolineales bacterium]|nr:N-acetyl-gamma-glutamyl-phosphate reductase [Anaerolineae bacterium]HIP87998.1 N-acetyl-gamma-glutamyl-phosphate reductase [Anaerolineales bacterium]
MTIQASIVGASGYVGGELLRLLLAHPHVEVSQITSETHAGQYAYFLHPNLRGHTDLRFVRLADLKPCDLLFLALPHGQAMDRIDHFAGLAERIIDLSADFRLRDPADYPRWYGREHPAPEWLDRFVYGMPELHREKLRTARYASGTGCNAIVTLLALWPLYRRGLVREAVIDLKVGSSEGGAKPTPASHHPERAGVVRTYAPVGHRHLAELIQELHLDPIDPRLHFSITSVGIVRGALATCHCLLKEDLDEREVWRIYREDYADEPFVRLVRARRGIHRYPEPKILTGSNYCDIGFAADPGHRRLVVVAAIDNLMKGAAGNGVQTMNVMCGWPERTGLEFPGLHPV